jgi:hypothetical protein
MTNIIQGQFGPKPKPALEPGPYAPKPKAEPQPLDIVQGVDMAKPGTEEQGMAILAGTSFIFIGLKPSDKGMDFYTAMHGDPADLSMVQDDLPDVIGRLYTKKGIPP